MNPHRPDAAYPDRRLAGQRRGAQGRRAPARAARGRPGGGHRRPGRPRDDRHGGRRRARSSARTARSPGWGCERLRPAPRPGHRGPARRGAGVAAASVTWRRSRSSLAPRLNAAGRVGEAGDAAALLLADDPAEARGAGRPRSRAANATRRDVTRTPLAEARGAPRRGDPAADRRRRSWSGGPGRSASSASSPVASRRSTAGRRWWRPRLGDVLRASCRAPDGYDLAAALQGVRRPARPPRRAPRRGGLRDRGRTAGTRSARASWRLMGAGGPHGSAARSWCWTSPSRRASPTTRCSGELAGARADGAREPDAGGRRPRSHRDPHPGRRRRACPADPPPRRRRRSMPSPSSAATSSRRVHVGDRVDVAGRLGSRRFGGYESLQLEILDVAPAPAAAAPGARRARRSERRRGAPGADPGAVGRDPRRPRAPATRYRAGARRARSWPRCLLARRARRRAGSLTLVAPAAGERPVPPPRGRRPATGPGRRRVRTPGRTPSAVRAAGHQHRGLDRRAGSSTQGRQPLDPGGHRGPPAHGHRPRLATGLVGRRSVGLLHRDPRRRAAVPGGRESGARYDLRYPILTRIRPDGTGARGDPLRPLPGRHGARRGSSSCAIAGRAPRTARDWSRSSSDGTGPDQARTSSSSWSTSRRKRLTQARPSGAAACWATRTRPGARTGSTSLYVKNGREAARGLATLWRLRRGNGEGNGP